MKILSGVTPKIWAWLFLYLLTVVFLSFYFITIWQLLNSLHLGKGTILFQSNQFWLLTPILLPVWHTIFYFSKKGGGVGKRYTKLIPYAVGGSFIIVLCIGFVIDSLVSSKISELGYVECVNERKQGLRSVGIVFKKESKLCQ